ncbi:hypothetical protein [Fredinandcohnia sp. 179-A 10B2 NHS]|uniref:hypothetical protein n=1 Tax=Fredinandcohnia sp. 179-A 10B2 NHS TaxID=3235176 RepID=UPI00399F5B28
MKFLLVAIILLFIVIGIFKNKEAQYVKQSGVAIMLLATLNAIGLLNIDIFSNGGEPISYLDIFVLDPERVELYGILSMGAAMIGLIMYLYADVRR